MNILNPATAAVLTTVHEDTPASLSAKFAQLTAGQTTWKRVPLSQRVEVLKAFGALLKERIEESAALLTSEVGKPLQQSRNEVNGACARISWLTDNAVRYLSDETMTEAPGLVEKIVYEALGVVCNISAWNYPYLVGVNVFVPALLAGNACMYKPSEFATLTGLHIEKLLKEAGVPDDVFQVAVGGKDVGEVLLEMPFNGYFFTGSGNTGRHIYQKVATRMVPCQLELGGKDPVYIADDITDIQSVAAGTADGAFYNNGQSCCGVERIYVHEAIYDAFVEAFVAEVNTYRLGDPTADGVYLGAITREAQLAVLEAQVADAVAKGATVLTGGRRADRPGNFFEPTVLANVDHTMQVMQDESFGPIIGLMKVQDDAEAVRLMQDTAYGLTAGVYTPSQARAEAMLAQINTGTAYWNCCDRVSAALPWSGRNGSGFGATLSHAGLRAFVQPKAYHLKG